MSEKIRKQLKYGWSVIHEADKGAYSSDCISFCIDGFKRHVDIPVRITEFDIVFTKRAKKESFEFDDRGRLVDDFEARFRVPNLYWSTNHELGNLYRKGYKFFHFEYEDKP